VDRLTLTSVDSGGSKPAGARGDTTNITLDFSDVKDAVRMEEVGNTGNRLEQLFRGMEALKDVIIKNVRTWPHGYNFV